MENYKMFLNVKGNGTMYKEFKLKNTNWTIMFNFYKSPSSFSKGHNLLIFSTTWILFVPLAALCGELQIFLEAQK